MSLGTTLYQANSKSHLLQGCPICSGLPENSVLSISRIAREKRYAKGDFLMQEGNSCDGFFLVLSGKVRVYKSAASGKEKVLLVAETGMTFGEDALFGEGIFLEMAVALTETKVLHIPRTEFLGILTANPQLSFQVMESLCLWIRRLGSSVENIAFLSARVRIARFLKELSRKEDSFEFVLPMKKKEIADQLGLAPETFSRALQEFSQEGIVEYSRRTIHIVGPELLEDVLNEASL